MGSSNTWRTIGRFWSMQKPYQAIFYRIVALILLVELASISERWLLKAVIDALTESQGVATAQTVHVLTIVGIVFLAAISISALATWLRLHTVNVMESHVITDLKRKFFNHILGLSHNFHTTHRTGSMIARMTRGARAIEKMMDVVFFNYVGTILRFIAVTVSLLFIGWQFSLIIALSAFAFVAYSYHVQRSQFAAAKHFNDTEDIEKGNISDIFTNVDSVKYYGKEKAMSARYAQLTDKTREAMVTSWNYWPRLDGAQVAIIMLGTGALVATSVHGVMNGTLGIDDIVFIYAVNGMLAAPLFRFVQGVREFYQGMVDFESLYQYADITNEVVDQPNAPALKVKDGEISFSNIEFSYGKRPVFTKFSLHISKNTKVALVGKSGSGKSTLVKLLYRLYDVQGGKITIDGTDIRGVQQESLRSELSIVPQECMLFDDTLYNNILFSRPDATREQVMRAIQQAQLKTLVEQLPQKENTIVGERGVRLSGGEKQRVSIARALLADKKILVLDEATSSLDSQTEHAIQESLHTLMKGRTTIIIAHRLSTIMEADRIVVLSKGKIVQTGKHRELIKKRGQYHDLWDLQRGGYLQ